MTPRDLVSAGFVLLAAYLMVAYLVSLADAFAMPLTVAAEDGVAPSASLFIMTTGIVALSGLVFLVAPAVLMLRRREEWARRLFPADNAARVEKRQLAQVGLMLLGVYFAVAGLGSLVTGLVQFPSREALSGSWVTWVAHGAVQSVSGLALVLLASRRSAA